jgi:hypothetical protein
MRKVTYDNTASREMRTTEQRRETMRMDVFIAKAECKWYAGEETLPHSLDRIRQEQITKVLESSDKYPQLDRRFAENKNLATIEPHEVVLDKDKITKEPTPDGKVHELFEGELIFVIKVPSSYKMDSQQLLKNMNVLFSIACEYSSTKLIDVKYLGTNTM